MAITCSAEARTVVTISFLSKVTSEATQTLRHSTRCSTTSQPSTPLHHDISSSPIRPTKKAKALTPANRPVQVGTPRHLPSQYPSQITIH